MAIRTKEELYAAVKETRAILKEYRIGSRDDAQEEVSQATRKDYERIARARLDLDDEDAGQLMDGVTRQSWSKVRAALLYESERICLEQTRLQDVLQRAWKSAKTDQERAEAFELVSEVARKANMAAKAFMWVSADKPPEFRSEPKRTKRRSLPPPKLSEDWRSVGYEAASDARKPAFAVMWAGARPVEIEKGVQVEMGLDPGTVTVRIEGAKTGPHSGQELRTLVFQVDTPLGRALAEHAGNPGNPTLVRRRAVRLNKDFAAMREAKQLPKKISPYSLRHQFCADLKVDDWFPEWIARAMGHASARSQGNYGSVKQGRGGLGLISVEATRDVRTEWNRGPSRDPENPFPG